MKSTVPLPLLAGCALASLVACGETEPKAPVVERMPEAAASSARAECAFGRGDVAARTLGEEIPVGDEIPIDHFILLMMENRSFDHYFGTMPGVDGIPPGYTMPDANGDPVAPYHETRFCIEDVRHGWNDSHVQYADGANDGFIVNNDPNGERAVGYFTEEDLPFYHQLYATFAMSDRHFASLLGPTFPNRLYYMAGTSFGFTFNSPVDADAYGERPSHVFDLLDEAGVSWRHYHSDLPTPVGLFPEMVFRISSKKMEDFFRDLEAGDLPAVTYLDPSFRAGVEQTDEHPPANPQFGQAFVKMIVEAVMQSEFWPRTALIITYDEHGGFFDHVPPPEACPPDEHEPRASDGSPAPHRFDRLGFRVPLVVVSPYAKAGYVSHETSDLTSVLRLVEARFGLPALTSRDANAWPLLDMFDFDSPPHVNPPTLVDATIDEARQTTCHLEFPG